MKHTVAYNILIEGRSKELLIKEVEAKIAKLDHKFGIGIGAKKERLKLQQQIETIKNFEYESKSA